MPHWRTMIEKDHLAAWDLVVPGTMTPRDYTLEISRVESKVLKTKGDANGKRRLVIHFVKSRKDGKVIEARKGFVCNSTNAEIIETMYGADVDAWPGNRITLYQGDVRNPKGKGTVKGIKVRTRKPTGTAEAPHEDAPIDEAMRAEQNEAWGRTNEEPSEPVREPGEEG